MVTSFRICRLRPLCWLMIWSYSLNWSLTNQSSLCNLVAYGYTLNKLESPTSITEPLTLGNFNKKAPLMGVIQWTWRDSNPRLLQCDRWADRGKGEKSRLIRLLCSKITIHSLRSLPAVIANLYPNCSRSMKQGSRSGTLSWGGEMYFFDVLEGLWESKRKHNQLKQPRYSCHSVSGLLLIIRLLITRDRISEYKYLLFSKFPAWRTSYLDRPRQALS